MTLLPIFPFKTSLLVSTCKLCTFPHPCHKEGPHSCWMLVYCMYVYCCAQLCRQAFATVVQVFFLKVHVAQHVTNLKQWPIKHMQVW